MPALTAGGHRIELSSPDKVLFPDDGITKLDLATYYARVAERMVPLVDGHPLALVRYPNGIDGQRFFQKSAPAYFPEWIDRMELPKREGGETEYVLCCRDAATIVYLANHNCIEVHALLAHRDRPQCPDRIVFDFDPSTPDFEPVREGARLLKERLDDLGLASFLMTSGSRGLHVWVPIVPERPFDEAKAWTRDLAASLAADHDFLTVEFAKAERGDRVFVDYLRNGYGQHSVVPYGVRAKPGAPVATPLGWKELDDPKLDPRRWTVRNLFRRLGQRDDPWSGFADAARPLPALS